MAIPSSHTNEINELLRKFHDGNISSEEYAQLSEKMKTTSDMELYKELEEHWILSKNTSSFPTRK